MYFSALKLRQFRNYESLEVSFGPDIHCITGENGSGKTNLLEALHFLALTRGWLPRNEKAALRENETFFFCEGVLQEDDRMVNIQCNFLEGKGKKLLINGVPLEKMSSHIGRVPLVSVLPNDTALIHGTPSARRKFMDGFIAQFDAEYLRQLILYERALEQRNALLALFLERNTFDTAQLQLWDAQLIPAGRFLLEKRKRFLEDFRPLFTKYFHLIVSDREQPSVGYETQFASNSKQEWEQLMEKMRDRDRFSGRTQAGVHKDDILFDMDGKPLRSYGSQGQQKTFVIALKLAQYALLEMKTEKAPLLLLDDIFDKLDERRLAALAQLLDTAVKGQVFITDTSAERMRSIFSRTTQRRVRYYSVNSGKLQSEP